MQSSFINQNKKTENLFIVVVMLLVFGISTLPPIDTDMWWHLRSGDEMWHQGSILLKDVFSYTRAGADWVNAFWLSDLGLFGLLKLGGFFAITVAVAAMAVTLMSIILLHMEGGVYLNGLLILLAMIGIHPNWSARPQLMSFLLLAILDYFLDRHRLVKRQPLWLLLPVFAIWGNLHGGFIWGVLLLAAIIVGEGMNNLLGNTPTLSWKETGSLSLWSILAGLAVSLNPNGISIWKLPFQQVDVSLSIVEWLSPDFHQFYAHPLLWLIFLLIFSVSYSGKRISFADLFKALGFTYLFFVAQRNMGPFAIILLPILARHLTPALQSFSKASIIEEIKNKFAGKATVKQPSQKFNYIVNSMIVSLLATVVLANAYLVSMPERMEEKLPMQAVRWVQTNQPTGPIFNSYNWGGYLTWALREYPVFIDGRADLYGDEMINKWNEINRGSEAGLILLDTYKINLIFTEPDSPLLEKLPASEWKEDYRDTMIAIYTRQHPIP